MTCNALWDEIVNNIGVNEKAIDRPDIVVKVFNQKVKELKNEIANKCIFGKCIAFTYVIEFQKRGLPHIHMLIFLDAEDKLHNADEVDKYIWSEIPDKVNNPRLYEIVKKFMIHGPCGERNLNSPCMDEKKEKCTTNFPKLFNDSKMYNTTGYPLYRRRNDGNIIHYPGNK